MADEVGVLRVAPERDTGLWGVSNDGTHPRPIDLLQLVGPGMHSFHLPLGSGAVPLVADTLETLRWSRTIGAFGGESVWRRLISLRVAVIGCGRTGSIAVGNLARLGVRHLVLVDPDVVDMHNLGEMQDVGVAALGHHKADVLATHLRQTFGQVGVTATGFASTLAAGEAMEAAKTCDVVMSCSDNDAARLTTAIMATMYHQVMIDIGSGVFFDAPGRANEPRGADANMGTPRDRTMGADVRVIVPGDGCVLCRGGLSNFAGAVEDICLHGAHLDPARAVTTARAGSLHSLNQIAAGLATRMLEDLVAERLPGSRWAHLEFDDRGNLSTRYPHVATIAAAPDCLLCARAGVGDDAL
jgi:hypothetical protein